MRKAILILSLLAASTTLQAQTKWQKVYSSENLHPSYTKRFGYFTPNCMEEGVNTSTNISFISNDAIPNGCFVGVDLDYAGYPGSHFNQVKTTDGSLVMTKPLSHDSVTVTIAAMNEGEAMIGGCTVNYLLGGVETTSFANGTREEKNLIQTINENSEVSRKFTTSITINEGDTINPILYHTNVKDVIKGGFFALYFSECCANPYTEYGYIAIGNAMPTTVNAWGTVPYVWVVNTSGDVTYKRLLQTAGRFDYRTEVESISQFGIFANEYLITGSRVHKITHVRETYVARLNYAFDVVWEKGFPDIAYNAGMRAVVDNNGDVVITGQQSRDYINQNSQNTGKDLFLLKLDASGNTIWQKNYTPINVRGVANDIITTNDGGYLLAGTIDSISSTGTFIRNVAILVKTDADGNEQWSKIYLPDTIDGTSFMNVKKYGNGYIAAGNAYYKFLPDGAFLPSGMSDTKSYTYLVRTDEQGNAATAGMQEITILPLSTYPNPTTDVLTVTLPSTKNKATHYQLYSVDGTLVLNNKIEANTTSLTLSISHLAAGNYQLIIPIENTYYRASIIKN